MLVFTAGLLLRLLKTGVYRLEQASLMLLLDAFTGALVTAATAAAAAAAVCCQSLPAGCSVQ